MPPKKKIRAEAQWEYEADGKWTHFDSIDAAMLEKECVARKSAGSFQTTNFSFNAGYGTIYTIDYDKMTQTNESSKKVRKIRRVSASDEVCWEYKDDNGMFVEFYDDDRGVIESLYRENGLNSPAQTKKLSWNKGYNSMYTYIFTKETSDPTTNNITEVIGTQKNEDSGKVRELKRTPKKLPWEVAGYGISGDKDALAKVLAAAAAATAKLDVTATTPATADSTTTTTTAAAVASAPAAPAATAAATPAPSAAATATPVAFNALTKSSSLSLPTYWQKANLFDGVGGFHEVKLDDKSDEFKFVTGLLLSTIGKKVNIVHVMRLENAAMFAFYAMTRMTIGASNTVAVAGDDPANEKFLFTGERIAANMLTIRKFGFDTRVVPAGGQYGQGLYFGTKASFADNGRCIQNSDGTKDMLVCRVAAGRTALGKQGIRRPPPLDPAKPTMALYNACVDNESDPQTYVVFDNKQAYPEYIVRYI